MRLGFAMSFRFLGLREGVLDLGGGQPESLQAPNDKKTSEKSEKENAQSCIRKDRISERK